MPPRRTGRRSRPGSTRRSASGRVPAPDPRPGPPAPSSSGPSAAADGPFELGLVHLGPARDVALPGLVIELLLGPPARPAMRAQPAPAPGGDVVRRRTAGLF